MLILTLFLQPINVNAQSTSIKDSVETFKYIESIATEYNLPVELVVQVIKVESDFNPSAQSKHGKYADEGLMQLNNQYSHTYAGWIGINDFNPLSVEQNIRVGCFHLSNIKMQQESNTSDLEVLYLRTLTVYNAGGGYLKKYGIRREYTNKFDVQKIIRDER